MAIQLSKAESWDTIYQASKFINFTGFDYATVKQSLIDYFRLTHPEFNNWIETDEFVMILEAFAYVCELCAYRLDMVANENLLSTAQRKDSVLKLAKFISYNPSRNIPGSGLVKITSISTTERVYDLNGNNLANSKIIWNDSNNVNWQSQFFAVINATLLRSFGDVLPSDRVQVFDQIFELYSINNIPFENSVIQYKTQVQNKSIDMELTSVELTTDGPIEQRPKIITTNNNQNFNILYGSDGLGNSSNYTGFFMLTKQGILKRTRTDVFDGITPHQSFNINVKNINNTDVWVNQITSTDSIAWEAVDTINEQNIIFSNNPNKNKYEINTLDNDQISILFGDGDFANIPNGIFDIWYRTSDPDPIPIPMNAISEVSSNFAYLDSKGNIQNAIFTFSLVQPIQNAAPSEDIEHIKINAPSVYYTQNRMVNARDYNSLLLQDNTILKLASINRAYAGESKYTGFNDPSDTYQNINHFGTDLSIYTEFDIGTITVSNKISALSVLINHIQPLLSNNDTLYYRAFNNISPRRYFTGGSSTSEQHDIVFNFMGEVYSLSDMNAPPATLPFGIYYSTKYYPHAITSDDWLFHIDVIGNNWVIKYKIARILANSPSTKFWNYATNQDNITILKSNAADHRTLNNTKFLTNEVALSILNINTFKEPTQYIGQMDYNTLNVSISDNNNDGVPDIAEVLQLTTNTITIKPDTDKFFEDKVYYQLFDRVFDMPFDSFNVETPTIELPYDVFTIVDPVTGKSDVEFIGDVSGLSNSNLGENNTIVWKERDINKLQYTNKITIIDNGSNNTITVKIKDYVYFYRPDIDTPYSIIDESKKINWFAEAFALLDPAKALYTRKQGRSGLNFLWQHTPTDNMKINPSCSNIIDCFIITRGYYQSTMNWINGIGSKPAKPLPHELRASYNKLITNKMISDEMIIKSGELKVIFGKYAAQELQAKFLVVKSPFATFTDNQIKSSIVTLIYEFFNIRDWDFGNTFNFTELSTYVHNSLNGNISSFVIKPKSEFNHFGNLFQIFTMEHEILVPSIDMEDIEMVQYLTSTNIL